MTKNQIYFSDNLPILQSLQSESINLIYIDPPFNTGKVQGRTKSGQFALRTETELDFKGSAMRQ